MIWNDILKREIPKGWINGTLLDIADFTNGLACQKYRPINDEKLAVIKIKEMHEGFSSETEYVRMNIPESASLQWRYFVFLVSIFRSNVMGTRKWRLKPAYI